MFVAEPLKFWFGQTVNSMLWQPKKLNEAYNAEEKLKWSIECGEIGMDLMCFLS